MMTRGGRGVKNAENLMTSYVNDPFREAKSLLVGYYHRDKLGVAVD